jgi:hypothetical protein
MAGLGSGENWRALALWLFDALFSMPRTGDVPVLWMGQSVGEPVA